MSRSKSLVIGAFLLIIAIIAGGWFLEISPQRAITSNLNSERANVLALNSKNQLLLTQLKKEYQNIAPLKSQLDLLNRSIPPTANVSAFISELNSTANTYNVTIKSIVVSDAKPYALAAQAPATNGTKEPPAPDSNLKINSANFVIIPLQISISGKDADVLDFVNGIQKGQRLFLISTFTSAGSIGSNATSTIPPISKKAPGLVDASVGGFIYVLLD